MSIEIGKVYSAKIGGTFLPVRIDKSLGHGRYEGASMPSGAKVKIVTDAIKGDGQTEEKWAAGRTPKVDPQQAAAVDKAVARNKADKKAARVAKAEKKERKPGILDCAVAILAEAKKPMKCDQIVQIALERKMWKTGGATPAATLYSALLRHIQKNGKESRFRKTGKGTFELAK